MTSIIGSILSFIIGSLIYPLTVLAIFIGLGGIIIGIVFGGREENMIRRLLGALLPILVLAIIQSSGEYIDIASKSPRELAWWHKGLIILGSGIVGVVLVEGGRWLLKTDSEVAASVYAMLLSCVFSFIMLLYMYQKVSDFNYYILGFISGGFLDTIFRGVPKEVNMNKEILWSIFNNIKIVALKTKKAIVSYYERRHRRGSDTPPSDSNTTSS